MVFGVMNLILQVKFFTFRLLTAIKFKKDEGMIVRNALHNQKMIRK